MKDNCWPGLEKATLKTLSADDALRLNSDIDSVVSPWKEPFIAELIQGAKPDIQALVEAVNHHSQQGYGGFSADGAELTAQWITVDSYNVWIDRARADVPGIGTKKSSWQRNIAASGIQNFVPQNTLGEEEGVIIIGWMDKVAEPVTNQIKLYKDVTEESVVEPLAFRATHRMCCKDHDCKLMGGSVETPVVKGRRPIIIGPEVTWRIQEKKPCSGCDALQPLGFFIRRAKDAWNLAM